MGGVNEGCRCAPCCSNKASATLSRSGGDIEDPSTSEMTGMHPMNVLEQVSPWGDSCKEEHALVKSPASHDWARDPPPGGGLDVRPPSQSGWPGDQSSREAEDRVRSVPTDDNVLKVLTGEDEDNGPVEPWSSTSSKGSDADGLPAALPRHGGVSESDVPSSLLRSPQPSSLEEGELVLGFETPDGAIREVRFHHRPLGIKHSNSVPVTVIDVNPGSAAAELGVRPGWKIRQIANEDMSTRDFLYVFQTLFKSAGSLRPWGSRFEQ